MDTPIDTPTTPPLRLRPAQEAILAYRSGRMAVSAVPGSGKTFTLSLLAAQAAGAAASPTGTTPDAGPADDRKRMEERVKQDLGAQAQPFPSGGLNVGTPGGIPMGKLMLLPEIAVVVYVPHGYQGGLSSYVAQDIIRYYMDQKKVVAEQTIPDPDSLVY